VVHRKSEMKINEKSKDPGFTPQNGQPLKNIHVFKMNYCGPFCLCENVLHLIFSLSSSDKIYYVGDFLKSVCWHKISIFRLNTHFLKFNIVCSNDFSSNTF
jgi:hypothetical protein